MLREKFVQGRLQTFANGSSVQDRRLKIEGLGKTSSIQSPGLKIPGFKKFSSGLQSSIFNPGLKNFFSGPQSAIFDQKQNQLIPMFREGHPLHEKSLNFRSFPSAVNYFTTKDDQTCFFFSRSNSSRQAQALQTNTFIQKV